MRKCRNWHSREAHNTDLQFVVSARGVNSLLRLFFYGAFAVWHTGRGVPRITEAYGKDIIRFDENSIVVTVPFERLGQEVYGDGQVIPRVDASVNTENVPVADEILSFCMAAKSILEIAVHLA